MSHVGGMHCVDVGFQACTVPAAVEVSHTMEDDDPNHTPPVTENTRSTSGSDAARAKHCVKLSTSVAAQNTAEAVVHVVKVVDENAPALQEPLVQDPTVMDGQSLTVEDTKNPFPQGTLQRENAPKSFPMHCSVQSGKALHVCE